MFGDLSSFAKAVEESKEKFPELWKNPGFVIWREVPETRFYKPMKPFSWDIDPYLGEVKDERAGEFKFPKAMMEVEFQQAVRETGEAFESLDLMMKQAAEPHVMGLSPEVIDPVKYKEFMRSL